MTVQIKTRDKNGKYVNACASDFAVAAFNHILQFSSYDGWQWMRDWLARWCLIKAQEASGDSVLADKWIERYQQIREIL